MRILLAGVYGLPSGVEVYTRLLAEELARRGHAVTIATRSPRIRSRTHAAEHDGGSIQEAPVPTASWRMKRFVRSLEGIRTHAAIGALASEIGADVVHATYLDLAASGDRPLVATAWDPEPGPLRRARLARERGDTPWEEFLYAITDRLACRRAAEIIAVTHAAEAGLSRNGTRSAYVPAFLRDEAISPPAPTRSKDCVMVANTIDAPRKGLDIAIESVRAAREQVAEMRLILLGSWVDRARIGTLPSFCEAHGEVSADAVAEALRSAGCCLLPSLWEEYGFAGLEALAAGTPLVCGPLPAFSGLESDGIVVVPARTPDSFAEALVRAIEIRQFTFPRECRASSAVPRILETYEAAAS